MRYVALSLLLATISAVTAGCETLGQSGSSASAASSANADKVAEQQRKIAMLESELRNTERQIATLHTDLQSAQSAGSTSGAAAAAGSSGRLLGEGWPTYDFPAYPVWPPETPSWTYSLDKEFLSKFPFGTTLYDVGESLKNSLSEASYSHSRFLSVPGSLSNGFVLVTRLEGIKKDGLPLSDDLRFVPPGGDEPFDVSRWLLKLFVAPKGRYRFVIFVMTDQTLVPNPNARLSESVAHQRLESGAVNLPADYRAMPFTTDYHLTALIYEYQTDDSTGDDQGLNPTTPGLIDVNLHIRNYGVTLEVDR